MTLALQTQTNQYTPPHIEIIRDNTQHNPYRRFFDFQAAYNAVMNHVAGLPSDQTPEKHTRRDYSRGLDDFLNFLANRLPTEQIMKEYIANLKSRPGRRGKMKTSTIASNYLTPARHFCRELARQPLPFEATSDPRELFGLPEWRERIRQAADVKNPRPDTKTNIAPLWNPEFKRLSLEQINAVLRSIDRSTNAGRRDYALLLAAFSGAFRVAELQRMTLNCFKKADGVILVVVRGKGSNTDPVGVGSNVLTAILDYVEHHNAGLADDDPRRIHDDTPLWQPYMHGKGNYPAIGYNNYCIDGVNKGLSVEAIRGIIRRRADMEAHSTRRSAAALAYEKGMPLPEIQALLRHKDPGVTLHYIGQKPDYEARTLANYVQFG